MAEETGKMKVDGGQATLNGKILALCDKPDSIAAALGFLRQQGFDQGSNITVTGSDSSIGSVPVFCIGNVVGAVELAARAFVARKKFTGGKKQAKKKSKKKGTAKKKGVVTKAGKLVTKKAAKKAMSKKKSARGRRSRGK